MTIPVEQLQKLDNITIIELFELQLFDPIHFATGDTTATTLYRFHNGTNEIKYRYNLERQFLYSYSLSS